MFVDVCGCLWVLCLMFVDVCGCLWMFVGFMWDVCGSFVTKYVKSERVFVKTQQPFFFCFFFNFLHRISHLFSQKLTVFGMINALIF